MQDNHYSNIYKGLEPNKYFYTIWSLIPNEYSQAVKNYLDPVGKHLEWYLGNSKERIPHITLRYLGYESDELKNKMISEKEDFEKIISKYSPIDISFGKIKIYYPKDKTYPPNKISTQVTDGMDKLRSLHKELLGLSGYSFYEDLEDGNFAAHLSVGKLDTINKEESEKVVGEYLSGHDIDLASYTLKVFELNFPSPQKNKSFRVKLNV